MIDVKMIKDRLRSPGIHSENGAWDVSTINFEAMGV